MRRAELEARGGAVQNVAQETLAAVEASDDRHYADGFADGLEPAETFLNNLEGGVVGGGTRDLKDARMRGRGFRSGDPAEGRHEHQRRERVASCRHGEGEQCVSFHGRRWARGLIERSGGRHEVSESSAMFPSAFSRVMPCDATRRARQSALSRANNDEIVRSERHCQRRFSRRRRRRFSKGAKIHTGGSSPGSASERDAQRPSEGARTPATNVAGWWMRLRALSGADAMVRRARRERR